MLIIFDFDGPLRQISLRGLFQAHLAVIVYQARNPASVLVDFQETKKEFFLDWRESMGRIRHPVGREDREILNQIFHSQYDFHARIYSWAERILEGLSKKHTLALLSNSSSVSILKALGELKSFFSEVVGCDQIKKVKPHPEGVELILERLGAVPKNTLIIGDSQSNVRAGEKAGILTGLVLWGFGFWEHLLGLKADYFFKAPEDLLLI